MATAEENKQFKDFLATENISEVDATTDDALRFKDTQATTEAKSDFADLGQDLFQPETVEQPKQEFIETRATSVETPLDKQIREKEEGKIDKIDVTDNVVTPTPAPVEKKTEVKDIATFKEAWANLENLTTLLWKSNERGEVEVTDIEISWDSVTGIRDGQQFKWTIDSAWNPIKTKVETGEWLASIEKENTTTAFSNMSSEDLFNSVNEGNLKIGSEEYNELLKKAETNPDLKAKLATVNKKIEDKAVLDSINGKKKEVTTINDLIATVDTVFSSDLTSKYESEIQNNTKLTDLNAKSISLQDEIDQLDIQSEDIEEQVREEFKWVPIWTQNTIINNRLKTINKTKRDLVRQLNTNINSYNAVLAPINTKFKIMWEDAKLNQAAFTQKLAIYNTERARMDKFEAAEVESESRWMAQTAQFQRDIALLDYKNALDDSKVTWKWIEREDWTYFERSDGTRDLVLEKITTPWITENVIFENWQAYSEIYDVTNQWVGFTSSNTSLNAGERELLNAPSWTRIPTRLNKDELSATNPWGKECWEYVNDIVARNVWSKIGSTWDSKLTYANENNWEIWSVAVWQVDPSNKTASKYGHAWIIVWESSDGKDWHIKSSNIKWQGIVSLVKVPKSVIWGYRSTSTIWVAKTFNVAQTTFLDSIEKVSDLSTKENKASLTTIGLTLDDALEYKSQNITTQKKEDYTTALSLLDKMMAAWGWDGFSDAIWLFSWARDTSDSWEITFDAGTDAADFKAQFDALVDGLTLPNLDKMSWVLTDKDIELLKNASKWGLSLKMSENDFENAVIDLRSALNRAKNWTKVPEGEVIFTDDDGIQYSKDTLTKEITDQVELWNSTDWKQWASVEEVRQWIKDNNINL